MRGGLVQDGERSEGMGAALHARAARRYMCVKSSLLPRNQDPGCRPDRRAWSLADSRDGLSDAGGGDGGGRGALRAGMEVGDGGSAATTSGPATVRLARQGKPHHPCPVLAAGEPLAQRRALLDGEWRWRPRSCIGGPVGTERGTPGSRVSATVGGCAGRGA